jgi:hypothetical protein
MRKIGLNLKETKQYIMEIMLGTALSVILFLLPSIGFAQNFDQGWITHKFDFNGNSKDSVGGWNTSNNL